MSRQNTLRGIGPPSTHPRSLALLATVIITAAVVRAWPSASAGLADRVLAGAAVALPAAMATFGALVAATGAPPALKPTVT